MPDSSQRTFDVVKAEHPANRLYAAAAVRPAWLSLPHRDRAWMPGRQLNQGSEGACVGFGCMGEALATPVRTKAAANPNAQGFRMFEEARRRDEFQGEDYEGTSLTGGGNAMKAFGYLDRYLWLHSPEEVALAIAHSGPVVTGIPWTTGMDELNEPDEYFSYGTGEVRGWHCVLLHGAHGFAPGPRTYDHGPWFDLRNSWGGSGNGRLPASVLAQMFEAGADAWVAEGRHQVGMLGVPQA